MRGDATQQLEMLSPVTPDTLVPKGHPIREIRTMVDRALGELSPVFDAMYAEVGRPSIPPEHLLKAMLLQAFYSIRSERQLCERLQYDLLFKWFLGLNIADPVFDHSTFSKNRDRLLEQTSPADSSKRSGVRLAGATCCRPSISPSMGRSSKLGHR